MVADGEMRQVEAARDLLVRLFLGDQGQDFDLSLGQRGGRRRHRAHRRAVGFQHDELALLQRAEPGDHMVRMNRFGNKCIGSITHNAIDRGVVVEHRDDRNRRARKAVAQHRQRLRGVHAGEQKVDGEQLRRAFAFGDAQHLFDGSGLMDREVWKGAADQLAEPGAEHRVIVGNDDIVDHGVGFSTAAQNVR